MVGETEEFQGLLIKELIKELSKKRAKEDWEKIDRRLSGKSYAIRDRLQELHEKVLRLDLQVEELRSHTYENKAPESKDSAVRTDW